MDALLDFEVLHSFDGFSVGDELMVRPDLVNFGMGDLIYGVTSDMKEFAGKTVRIRAKDGYDAVSIPGSYCTWSPEMFVDPDSVTEIKADVDMGLLFGGAI